MSELFAFPVTTAKLPSPMNCPTCGRFARVTMRGLDIDGSWWFAVNCGRCGPDRVW